MLIYIYIYIYIVIHRQTVSFYQNCSVWLDTQDARSRDRNPFNFTLDCVFRPLGHQADHVGYWNFKVFLFLETAAAFVYIFFYTLSATRVLNSFEEFCITLAAAGNSFAREVNPHGGMKVNMDQIQQYDGSRNHHQDLYIKIVHIAMDVSFRGIFLICSCHLSKHPLLCELF